MVADLRRPLLSQPHQSRERNDGKTPRPRRDRLLDLLRGIDLALMLIVNNLPEETTAWPILLHPDWVGASLADFVFPTFLFVSGVAMFYSHTKFISSKQADAVDDEGSISVQSHEPESVTPHLVKATIRRASKLFCIGLFINVFGHLLFRSHDFFSTVRIMGVLQRIALCNLIVGLITLLLWKVYHQVIAILGLMALYIGLMLFVNVPDCGRGILTRQCSFESFFDRLVLGKHTWQQLPYDPEGFVSTLTAVCSCYLGFLHAYLLNQAHSPSQKYHSWLAEIGAHISLGCVSLLRFPFMKKLWTPPFVFFCGAVDSFILLIFYLISGGRNRVEPVKPLQPFISLGMNPLLVFVAADVFALVLMFVRVSNRSLYNWPYHLLTTSAGISGGWANFLSACSHLLLWLIVAMVMDHKRIYLKVS